MALLTELTDAVAKVEGLPETFVAGVARYLREAEHIRQGGRGLSAAKMLPQDAAALLIGVNATRLAKDSVEAFESYSSLSWAAITQRDELPEDGSLNLIWAALKPDVTLIEALSRLISLSIGEGSSRSPLETVFSKEDWRLDITFSRPRNVVQLEVIDLSEKGLGVVLRGVFFKGSSDEPTSDRRDLVTITHRTILEVGKTLAS